MALINCPECAKEISDKAPACPHCGCPLSVLSNDINVTVTMATQRFLISVTVTIALNGKEVGILGDGQSMTFKAPKGKNVILLTGSMRKKEIEFETDKDVQINAKWNRISGGLDASVFQ